MCHQDYMAISMLLRFTYNIYSASSTPPPTAFAWMDVRFDSRHGRRATGCCIHRFARGCLDIICEVQRCILLAGLVDNHHHHYLPTTIHRKLTVTPAPHTPRSDEHTGEALKKMSIINIILNDRDRLLPSSAYTRHNTHDEKRYQPTLRLR